MRASVLIVSIVSVAFLGAGIAEAKDIPAAEFPSVVNAAVASAGLTTPGTTLVRTSDVIPGSDSATPLATRTVERVNADGSLTYWRSRTLVVGGQASRAQAREVQQVRCVRQGRCWYRGVRGKGAPEAVGVSAAWFDGTWHLLPRDRVAYAALDLASVGMEPVETTTQTLFTVRCTVEELPGASRRFTQTVDSQLLQLGATEVWTVRPRRVDVAQTTRTGAGAPGERRSSWEALADPIEVAAPKRQGIGAPWAEDGGFWEFARNSR